MGEADFLRGASKNGYGGAGWVRNWRSRCWALRGCAARAEPVSFDTRKATALLAHLALAERPRSREALCALLWPAQDPDTRAGRCGARCRRCARRSARNGSTRAADSVALRDGAGLERRRAPFRSLAAADAAPEQLAERRRGLPRRAARGFLAARQPRVRRLVRARGRRAAARARRGARPAGAGAGGTRRVRPTRSATRGAGSRSTRCTSRPTAS